MKTDRVVGLGYTKPDKGVAMDERKRALERLRIFGDRRVLRKHAE